MRCSGFTFLQLVVTLALVLLAAVIFVPVLSRSPEHRPRGSNCANNSRHIALSLLQYAGDNNDRLPPKKWANAIYPFIKTTAVYRCDQGKRKELAFAKNEEGPVHSTDYWINGNRLGQDVGLTKDPQLILMIGEGNDGIDLNDAAYRKYRLNQDWLSDETKPTFRHKGGAIYTFGDGHYEWLEPATISRELSRGAATTFRFK